MWKVGRSDPGGLAQENKVGQCQVCHKVIAARWGQTCQKHAPSWRDEEEAKVTEGRPVQSGMPSWEEISSTNVMTKNYVPKGVTLGSMPGGGTEPGGHV